MSGCIIPTINPPKWFELCIVLHLEQNTARGVAVIDRNVRPTVTHRKRTAPRSTPPMSPQPAPNITSFNETENPSLQGAISLSLL